MRIPMNIKYLRRPHVNPRGISGRGHVRRITDIVEAVCDAYTHEQVARETARESPVDKWAGARDSAGTDGRKTRDSPGTAGRARGFLTSQEWAGGGHVTSGSTQLIAASQ